MICFAVPSLPFRQILANRLNLQSVGGLEGLDISNGLWWPKKAGHDDKFDILLLPQNFAHQISKGLEMMAEWLYFSMAPCWLVISK
jgi:hypothetical protein